MTTPQALAYWCAACRETFEEVGILLARRVDGATATADQLAQLRLARTAIIKDPAAFYAALAAAELVVEPWWLPHWGHWITPPSERHRFDTHFFLSIVGADERVDADTDEVAAIEWRAVEALAADPEACQPRLLGPTALTIVELVDAIHTCGGLSALLSFARQRDTVPVMPKIGKFAGGEWVVLPWDLEYEQLPGDGSLTPRAFPASYLRLPSRSLLPR